MYDELVKRLRMRAHLFKQINQMENSIMDDAADAIEKLSKCVGESIPKGDAEIIIAEVAKPRWIPVTERLPKYGERVLVFGGVTMYVAYYEKNRYGGESWHKLNSKSHYCNPTHWMPLPEPPKEE